MPHANTSWSECGQSERRFLRIKYNRWRGIYLLGASFCSCHNTKAHRSAKLRSKGPCCSTARARYIPLLLFLFFFRNQPPLYVPPGGYIRCAILFRYTYLCGSYVSQLPHGLKCIIQIQLTIPPLPVRVFHRLRPYSAQDEQAL